MNKETKNKQKKICMREDQIIKKKELGKKY